MGPGGVPITVADVARVQLGPEIRRGAADWNGKGEAVGGIVVMRIGSNALDVIRALEGPFYLLPCISDRAHASCDDCVGEGTCGVRLVMREVRDATTDILKSATLTAVNDQTLPEPR